MAVETKISVENQHCVKCGEEVPYDAPRDGKGYYCEKHSPNALFKLAATKGYWTPEIKGLLSSTESSSSR